MLTCGERGGEVAAEIAMVSALVSMISMLLISNSSASTALA